MLNCHRRYLYLPNAFVRPSTLGLYPRAGGRGQSYKKKGYRSQEQAAEGAGALKRAYEEIGHFCLKCIAHIFEKIKFKKEMKNLLEVSRVTWYAAVRVAQV